MTQNNILLSLIISIIIYYYFYFQTIHCYLFFMSKLAKLGSKFAFLIFFLSIFNKDFNFPFFYWSATLSLFGKLAGWFSMSITNVFDCVGRCVERLGLEEELFTLIAGRKAGNVFEVEKGSLVHQKHLFSKVTSSPFSNLSQTIL